MKRLCYILFFISLTLLGWTQTPTIAINQLGYLKNMKKSAWVTNLKTSGQNWHIKKVGDKSTVYSGIINNPGSYDEACAENVLRLDFSSLTEEGHFYIEVEGVGKSYEFAISNYCYNDAFKVAVKSYYYQRSGVALAPEFAGIWSKPASHTNDAYIYGGYNNNQIIKGKFVKSPGGWYDAGDFGKKIVPASVALYPFLKLAEFYPEIANLAEIDIPNQLEVLPDLLAEAK
jgi:endoglucanase